VDEQRVRAAADRICREAHGLFMGTGEECRMVPVTAIAELVEAIDAEPAATPAPEDVPTDRVSVT
jgi:hypothetical protein